MMIMISSTETKRLTERAKFEPNRTSKYFHFKSANRSIKTEVFVRISDNSSSQFVWTNERDRTSKYFNISEMWAAARASTSGYKKNQKNSMPELYGVSIFTIAYGGLVCHNLIRSHFSLSLLIELKTGRMLKVKLQKKMQSTTAFSFNNLTLSAVFNHPQPGSRQPFCFDKK